jgi:prevent-host-death family protein
VATIGIAEAKNTLSALIDRVRRGESVLIADRGTPVARLEAVRAWEGGAASQLRELERLGVLRPPASAEAPMGPPPLASSGASALAALLGERRRSG